MSEPTRREWLPLLVLWLLLLPLFTPRLYASDEAKYFVHLRSLWFDGDIDYYNEYDDLMRRDPAAFGWLSELRDPPSPTGRRLNDAPIGSAVLWAPFYVAADAGVIVARALGLAVERDGYGRPYIWAICLGSLSWGSLGLLLLYRSARLFASPEASRWALVGLWLAGPLVFYLYITPPMAHANSMFTVALFVWLWLSGRGRPRSAWQWAALGAAGGLMVLVRELNWLMLLPVCLDEAVRLLRDVRDRGIGVIPGRLPGWGLFAAVLLVVVAPQFLVYWLLHRTLGPTPFIVSKFSSYPAFALDVLFSGFHGLFSWHPVTLLGVAGLALLARREPAVAAGLALAFVAQVLVIGSYSTWWGGAGFGARRFINNSPAFMLGLAALLDAVPRARRPLAHLGIVVLILWNCGLAIQYSTGMISREDPVTLSAIARNQFTEVPRRGLSIAWRFLTDRWSLVQNPPVENR